MNRKFSRRTAVVEQVAKELGITDQEEKAKLGAITRESKRKNLNQRELRAQWEKRLDENERKAMRELAEIKNRVLSQGKNEERLPSPAQSQKSKMYLGVLKTPLEPVEVEVGAMERRAIDYALAHVFERASAVEEWRIMESALRFGMGKVDLRQMKIALAERTELIRKTIRDQQMITTPAVLAEEQAMTRWVRQERGVCKPLALGHTIAEQKLTEEQRAAVEHVLSSRDRVIGIKGRAGTGKTTLMREAIGAMRGRGNQVLVMAPGSETAREVLPREGFPEACTVAQLLTDERLQNASKGAVWWVDEAGLLSSRSMAKLCDLSDRLDARIVLSGDPAQHRPVERGDALRILEQHAGLEMAVLEKVLRQKGDYKKAVEHLSRGELAEGFEMLSKMGAIVEVEGPELHKILANEYLKAVDSGETALVISPTHAEGRKVTEVIREELKRRNKLSNERNLGVLRRVELTEAERSEAGLYEPGWVLEFTKRTKGHPSGERREVAGIEEGKLILKDERGRETAFNPEGLGGSFEVFEKQELAIATGDWVQITKNGYDQGRKHRLLNGNRRIMEGFTQKGDLKLEGGIVVPADYGHLDQGYTPTSYSAQSKTVDRVFIAESTDSLLAANREQIYVSVSRGRITPRLFTDNLEALIDAAHETSHRVAAMDLVSTQETSDQANLTDMKIPGAKEFLGELPKPQRIKGLSELKQKLEAPPEKKSEYRESKQALGEMGMPEFSEIEELQEHLGSPMVNDYLAPGQNPHNVSIDRGKDYEQMAEERSSPMNDYVEPSISPELSLDTPEQSMEQELEDE